MKNWTEAPEALQQEFLEFLCGTCNFLGALESLIEEKGYNPDGIDEALHEAEVYLCEDCGWWCYPGEEPDGPCSDCGGGF